MFSGIVTATGKIISIEDTGSTKRITIGSSMSHELSVDQSISHDGVCLTVVHVDGDTHAVEVIDETQSKTSFAFAKPGKSINLEKAITLSSLLDGHLVQGHVDTILYLQRIEDLNGSWKMNFNLPPQYAGLLIPHGSICLNGISLTVANLYNDSFDVAIIPYTFEHTNFKFLREGDPVNVEFDLIGKYLLRQTSLKMK